MKRIALFFLFTLIISFVYSQEIKVNEIDEFTGKKRIETSWERISKMSMKNNDMKVSFSKIDDKLFLRVKIVTGFVCAIPENAEIIFKSNENIYKLNAFEYTISSTGDGATGLAGSSAMGIYVRYIGDMSFFEHNIINKVRIYFRDSYLDIDISEKGSKNINSLYDLILNT